MMSFSFNENGVVGDKMIVHNVEIRDHMYNYVFRLIYTSNALGATVYSPLFYLSYHM